MMKNLVFVLIAALMLGGCSQKMTTAVSTDTPPVADERGFYVKIGDRVPNFEMTLADGTTTSIKSLKGKVVMLQFTASWCSVCRKEMPHIEEEVWLPNKDKGLIVIGVDRDEPMDVVRKFAEEMKVTYPLALDPGADIFGIFADKKSGVTRNVIIDKKGKIAFLTRLFEKEEFEAMKEKIVELLAI